MAESFGHDLDRDPLPEEQGIDPRSTKTGRAHGSPHPCVVRYDSIRAVTDHADLGRVVLERPLAVRRPVSRVVGLRRWSLS